jgi:hypothetical protein
MPPTIRQSGMDGSTYFTRTMVRNALTFTPGETEQIIRIALPRAAAFHILSRTVGFCEALGTSCVDYRSSSVRNDEAGVLTVVASDRLQGTNDIVGASVVATESDGFFVIKVEGDSSAFPVYWTCELSIVQAVVL